MDHVDDEVHEQPEEAIIDDVTTNVRVFQADPMTHQCCKIMFIMWPRMFEIERYL